MHFYHFMWYSSFYSIWIQTYTPLGCARSIVHSSIFSSHLLSNLRCWSTNQFYLFLIASRFNITLHVTSGKLYILAIIRTIPSISINTIILRWFILFSISFIFMGTFFRAASCNSISYKIFTLYHASVF